jgi:hypothetical protein
MSDPELIAMGKVLDALADLDTAQRTRVVRWINEKLDLLPLISASKHQDEKIAREFANGAGEGSADKFEASLASHIREKAAEGSQVRRFMAAADWLRRRGAQTLTSGAVAKALQENQQSRLANPADCLNQNVAKGYCEKTKDGFFITPEGLRELGYK